MLEGVNTFKNPEAIATLRPVGIKLPDGLQLGDLIRVKIILWRPLSLKTTRGTLRTPHPMLKHLEEWDQTRCRLTRAWLGRLSFAIQTAYKSDSIKCVRDIRDFSLEEIASLPRLQTAAGFVKSVFDPEFNADQWLKS